MVLVLVPAALAALVCALAMFAPVSVRRGVAFTMFAVGAALLAACAFLGLYLYIATHVVV